MPIVLLRVDERLIHGQVVVGWGERIHIDEIVVVDDELSASSWEQEIYCAGVPPTMASAFVSVAQARDSLPRWRASSGRLVVLLRDVDSLARLAEGRALADTEVNLGGIHSAPGRERVLPYLYLNADEKVKLRAVADSGAVVTARDLPATRAVSLGDLIGAA